MDLQADDALLKFFVIFIFEREVFDCFTVDEGFNIVAFGSTFQAIYDSAQPYNDQTLEYASQQVQNMGANLGGTEILAPLKHPLW